MIFKRRARTFLFQALVLSVTSALGALLLAIGVQAEAPKKRQIAFYSNRDGNFEIYVMDVDGKNPQRLTANPAVDAGTVRGLRAGRKFPSTQIAAGIMTSLSWRRERRQPSQSYEQSRRG